MRYAWWWTVEGAPTPEEWSAFWAGATFLVTATAAVFALVQLRSYLAEVRERARPYVIADFGFRSTILYLHVWNSSQTPARNLRIAVTPPFESNRPDDARKLQRVTGPDFFVPQLAPGREIRWVLDTTPAYYANMALPRSYQVTLTYDDGRSERRKKPYSDVFTLSIEQWSEALADNDYPNKNWNIAHRVEGDIGKIRNSLDRIADALEPYEEVVEKREPDTAVLDE